MPAPLSRQADDSRQDPRPILRIIEAPPADRPLVIPFAVTAPGRYAVSIWTPAQWDAMAPERRPPDAWELPGIGWALYARIGDLDAG